MVYLNKITILFIFLTSLTASKAQCPVNATETKCGPNEVYNPCPKYCTFDADCKKVIHGITKDCPPPPSNYPCYPRCECKPGFVRIGPKCVSPKLCCMKANEILVTCPADCDNTCLVSYIPGGCSLQPCFIFGCKCKRGFVRDENTGQCVLFKNCT